MAARKRRKPLSKLIRDKIARGVARTTGPTSGFDERKPEPKKPRVPKGEKPKAPKAPKAPKERRASRPGRGNIPDPKTLNKGQRLRKPQGRNTPNRDSIALDRETSRDDYTPNVLERGLLTVGTGKKEKTLQDLNRDQLITGLDYHKQRGHTAAYNRLKDELKARDDAAAKKANVGRQHANEELLAKVQANMSTRAERDREAAALKARRKAEAAAILESRGQDISEYEGIDQDLLDEARERLPELIKADKDARAERKSVRDAEAKAKDQREYNKAEAAAILESRGQDISNYQGIDPEQLEKARARLPELMAKEKARIAAKRGDTADAPAANTDTPDTPAANKPAPDHALGAANKARKQIRKERAEKQVEARKAARTAGTDTPEVEAREVTPPKKVGNNTVDGGGHQASDRYLENVRGDKGYQKNVDALNARIASDDTAADKFNARYDKARQRAEIDHGDPAVNRHAQREELRLRSLGEDTGLFNKRDSQDSQDTPVSQDTPETTAPQSTPDTPDTSDTPDTTGRARDLAERKAARRTAEYKARTEESRRKAREAREAQEPQAEQAEQATPQAPEAPTVSNEEGRRLAEARQEFADMADEDIAEELDGIRNSWGNDISNPNADMGTDQEMFDADQKRFNALEDEMAMRDMDDATAPQFDNSDSAIDDVDAPSYSDDELARREAELTARDSGPLDVEAATNEELRGLRDDGNNTPDDLTRINEELERREPWNTGGILDSMLKDSTITDMQKAEKRFVTGGGTSSETLGDWAAARGNPKYLGRVEGLPEYQAWVDNLMTTEYADGNPRRLHEDLPNMGRDLRNAQTAQALDEDTKIHLYNLGYLPNAGNFQRIARGEEPLAYNEISASDMGRAGGLASKGKQRVSATKKADIELNREANKKAQEAPLTQLDGAPKGVGTRGDRKAINWPDLYGASAGDFKHVENHAKSLDDKDLATAIKHATEDRGNRTVGTQRIVDTYQKEADRRAAGNAQDTLALDTNTSEFGSKGKRVSEADAMEEMYGTNSPEHHRAKVADAKESYGEDSPQYKQAVAAASQPKRKEEAPVDEGPQGEQGTLAGIEDTARASAAGDTELPGLDAVALKNPEKKVDAPAPAKAPAKKAPAKAAAPKADAPKGRVPEAVDVTGLEKHVGSEVFTAATVGGKKHAPAYRKLLGVKKTGEGDKASYTPIVEIDGKEATGSRWSSTGVVSVHKAGTSKVDAPAPAKAPAKAAAKAPAKAPAPKDNTPTPQNDRVVRHVQDSKGIRKVYTPISKSGEKRRKDNALRHDNKIVETQGKARKAHADHGPDSPEFHAADADVRKARHDKAQDRIASEREVMDELQKNGGSESQKKNQSDRIRRAMAEGERTKREFDAAAKKRDDAEKKRKGNSGGGGGGGRGHNRPDGDGMDGGGLPDGVGLPDLPGGGETAGGQASYSAVRKAVIAKNGRKLNGADKLKDMPDVELAAAKTKAEELQGKNPNSPQHKAVVEAVDAELARRNFNAPEAPKANVLERAIVKAKGKEFKASARDNRRKATAERVAAAKKPASKPADNSADDLAYGEVVEGMRTPTGAWRKTPNLRNVSDDDLARASKVNDDMAKKGDDIDRVNRMTVAIAEEQYRRAEKGDSPDDLTDNDRKVLAKAYPVKGGGRGPNIESGLHARKLDDAELATLSKIRDRLPDHHGDIIDAEVKRRKDASQEGEAPATPKGTVAQRAKQATADIDAKLYKASEKYLDTRREHTAGTPEFEAAERAYRELEHEAAKQRLDFEKAELKRRQDKGLALTAQQRRVSGAQTKLDQAQRGLNLLNQLQDLSDKADAKKARQEAASKKDLADAQAYLKEGRAFGGLKDNHAQALYDSKFKGQNLAIADDGIYKDGRKPTKDDHDAIGAGKLLAERGIDPATGKDPFEPGVFALQWKARGDVTRLDDAELLKVKEEVGSISRLGVADAAEIDREIAKRELAPKAGSGDAIEENPDADIIIEHTPDGGTIIHGTSRNDGTADILKANGLKWSRNLGAWYVGRSRDKRPDMAKIRNIQKALADGGHDVGLDVDKSRRSAADIEASRTDRANDRATAMRDKADRKAVKAEQSESARKAALDQVPPMGEPIKVGHHSEQRHRRSVDKAWNALGKSVEADREADNADRKARIAEAANGARHAPSTVRNRADKLAADVRRWQRELDKGATGGRKEQLEELIADGSDDRDFWQGVRDKQIADGIAFDASTIKAGDQINGGGSQWYTVTKANKETLMVTKDGDTPVKISIDSVKKHRAEADVPEGSKVDTTVKDVTNPDGSVVHKAGARILKKHLAPGETMEAGKIKRGDFFIRNRKGESRYQAVDSDGKTHWDYYGDSVWDLREARKRIDRMQSDKLALGKNSPIIGSDNARLEQVAKDWNHPHHGDARKLLEARRGASSMSAADKETLQARRAQHDRSEYQGSVDALAKNLQAVHRKQELGNLSRFDKEDAARAKEFNKLNPVDNYRELATKIHDGEWKDYQEGNDGFTVSIMGRKGTVAAPNEDRRYLDQVKSHGGFPTANEQSTSLSAVDLEPEAHYPASSWNEPYSPDERYVVWNGKNPLEGSYTWQGANRNGKYYAAVEKDSDRLPQYAKANSGAQRLGILADKDSIDRSVGNASASREANKSAQGKDAPNAAAPASKPAAPTTPASNADEWVPYHRRPLAQRTKDVFDDLVVDGGVGRQDLVEKALLGSRLGGVIRKWTAEGWIEWKTDPGGDPEKDRIVPTKLGIEKSKARQKRAQAKAAKAAKEATPRRSWEGSAELADARRELAKLEGVERDGGVFLVKSDGTIVAPYDSSNDPGVKFQMTDPDGKTYGVQDLSDVLDRIKSIQSRNGGVSTAKAEKPVDPTAGYVLDPKNPQPREGRKGLAIEDLPRGSGGAVTAKGRAMVREHAASLGHEDVIQAYKEALATTREKGGQVAARNAYGTELSIRRLERYNSRTGNQIIDQPLPSAAPWGQGAESQFLTKEYAGNRDKWLDDYAKDYSEILQKHHGMSKEAADAKVARERKAYGSRDPYNSKADSGAPEPVAAPEAKAPARHKKGEEFTADHLEEGETLNKSGSIQRGDFKIIPDAEGYRIMEGFGSERLSQVYKRTLARTRQRVDAMQKQHDAKK